MFLMQEKGHEYILCCECAVIHVLSISELRREETGIRHVRMMEFLDGMVVGLARWLSGT
jgi:hypothetical protein